LRASFCLRAGAVDLRSPPFYCENGCLMGHTLYLQSEFDQAIQQYWKTLANDAYFVRTSEALG
jgi:hypothetical protein